MRRKIKFSQDFYLTSQINIILYWVLTMEPSTSIDLELVVMLLHKVEKNENMLLEQIVATSYLSWMRKEYFIPDVPPSYI